MRALWMRAFCAVTLLGCGDDAAQVDAKVPDAAPDAEPGVHASFFAQPDLAFLPTRLDGSGSSDALGRTLTYHWHFAAVPQGSQLSDGALGSAAQVAFVADRGGTYTLELTVSTPDGASDVARQDVKVPTATVFYYGMVASASMSQLAPGSIQSDGTGRRLSGCGTSINVGTSHWDAGPSDMLIQLFLTAAERSVDTFDPDPLAQPAPPLFAYAERQGGLSSAASALLVAGPDSACPSPAPVRLDDASAAALETYVRFSPDGHRVAWFDGDAGGPKRLLTAAPDAGSPHVLRANPAGDQALVRVAPAWRDAARVVWVESDPLAAGRFHIVQATDNSDLPPVTELLTCDPGVFSDIDEIGFAGDVLLVSARPSAQAPYDIYQMGSTCDRQMPLTHEPAYSRAPEFVVSPDGHIVFWSAQDEAPESPRQPGDLWILAGAGGAPQKLVGEPGMDDYQPRWLAGGRQLLWTRLPATSGADRPAGLMIANADGTNQRILIQDQTGPSDVDVAIGSSNGGAACSGVPGGSGAVGLGALVPLLLLLRRRRRRLH